MPTLIFQIPDLSCGHCVQAVTAAAQALDPQARVQADLSTRRVQVETTTAPDRLAAALREAGYAAQPLTD